MARRILAVVIGAVVASILISIVQTMGTALSPLPDSVDFSDPSAIDPADIPVVNMLWVLASYALGAVAGGAIAARIDPGFMPWNALIVGALFTAASIMNLMLIPSPWWFAVINLLMMIPLAWLGGRLMVPLGNAGNAGSAGTVPSEAV